MTDFVICKNRFEQWIILHPVANNLAWSGSRWVPIDHNGLPLDVQICNFTTATKAAEFAENVFEEPKGESKCLPTKT